MTVKALLLAFLLCSSVCHAEIKPDNSETDRSIHQEKEAAEMQAAIDKHIKFATELAELRKKNLAKFLATSKNMIIKGIELEETPEAHGLFDRDASYNYSVLVCVYAVNNSVPLPNKIIEDITARSATMLGNDLTNAEKDVATHLLITVVGQDKALKASLGVSQPKPVSSPHP